MKISLYILFVLSLSNAFSQTVNFEKCYEPLFNSGIQGITHDTSGYFYTVGSSHENVEFSAPGIFTKINQQGNFLFEKYYYYSDETYFRDIKPTQDGNFIIGGNISGCDFGISSGLILKINPNGDTLWTRLINPQELGVIADNQCRSVAELPDGKVIFVSDTTLYAFNSTGDSLFTFLSNEHFTTISGGFDSTILCGNQQGLIILNSSGQLINQLYFISPVGYISLLQDSTALLLTSNTLIKIDSNFNILNQLDLSTINFSNADVLVESGTIWLRKSQDSAFAALDLNFQLINSFSTLASSVNSNSFSVADTTIMVGGTELDVKNHCYLKTYSTSGNTTYYSSDLALTDVGFDTAYVTHPSSLPANVYELIFVCRLTITNTGTDTIHSFYANAESYLFGPCGYFKYWKEFNNLNIAPGQTTSIAIDTLNEYGMYIPHFPFTYQFCSWVSCPNNKPDRNPSNDYLCDTIVYEAPVGISEIQNENPVHIYPNPFVSEITIQFSDENGIGSEYEIYSIYGKKVLSGPCYDNENNINLSSLSSGVYMINIHGQKFSYSGKIIKL